MFENAPPDYPRIKVVTGFHELLTTPFSDGINALCWQRALPGDFGEIVRRVPKGEAITTIDESWLAGLAATVSPAGRAAIEILLADQRQLREHGLDPILDCVHQYTRDDPATPVPTDVYSFHADSATVETDTWLCTYHGPGSEGLRNDQALRRVDIPEIRARLLAIHGGADDAAFREYLEENCYDLHYAPAPHARPFPFGIGNLWRIAVQYPGSPVPPCIHRAPETGPADPPRLLLIS